MHEQICPRRATKKYKSSQKFTIIYKLMMRMKMNEDEQNIQKYKNI